MEAKALRFLLGIEGYGFTGGATPGTGKQGELLI